MAWLLRRRREVGRDHGAVFLAWAGGLPLGAALGASLGLAGWTPLFWAGTLPCLIVLVGQWMQVDGDLETKSRWRGWTLWTTASLAVVGINTENLRMAGLPWPRVLDTPRLQQGWRETAEAVDEILTLGVASQPEGLWLIAEDASTAALLDFCLLAKAAVLRPEAAYPRVHVVESAGWETVFDLWPNYSHARPGSREPTPFKGATALYVSRRAGGELPANLSNAFTSREPAAVLEIRRLGRKLHEWRLFYFYEYRGLPL